MEMPCFLANISAVRVKLGVGFERSTETVAVVLGQYFGDPSFAEVRVEEVVNRIL